MVGVTSRSSEGDPLNRWMCMGGGVVVVVVVFNLFQNTCPLKKASHVVTDLT
jgi:hypothetical protein